MMPFSIKSFTIVTIVNYISSDNYACLDPYDIDLRM